MALSSAERVRRHREKQKAERAAAQEVERQAGRAAPDLASPFLKMPFSEYALEHDGNWSDFEMFFDMLGIDAPDYSDDTGPKSKQGIVEEYDQPYGDVPNTSLGKAEVHLGLLLDAATYLATSINRYKLNEIDARIAEIERADLSDPKAKAKALQDIVTLQGIKSRLEGKTFRRSFAEISVKDSFSE